MGEIVHDGFNVVELTSLGIKLESIEDKIIVMMDNYKSGYECKTCNGNKVIVTKSIVEGGKDKEETCPDCNGQGAILLIPEISKSLPTSGVVVSVGEKCRCMQGDEKSKIRLGARVIFSPHIGTLIPFKGNIKLKIMREHEPLAIMYGADAAARDFIDYDTDFRG